MAVVDAEGDPGVDSADDPAEIVAEIGDDDRAGILLLARPAVPHRPVLKCECDHQNCGCPTTCASRPAGKREGKVQCPVVHEAKRY